MKNELFKIEQTYAIDKPKLSKLEVWPFLRHPVFYEIFSRKVRFSSTLRTRSSAQLLKNFFYGWTKWFRLRKFDYVFFNNADKRQFKKDDKQFDIYLDAWADRLGQEKCLFIEWAIEKHYPAKHTHSSHVVSDLPMKFLSTLIGLFISFKPENMEPIDSIKTDFDLKLDPRKKLRQKIAEMKAYQLLFRLIRPKAIFLISSFTKESIVVAAHLEDIKVFESQHGYIGNNHQFYTAHHRFDDLYYPDYLISFGNYERKKLPEGFLFSPEQIIPVGNFYLESIMKHFKSEALENLVAGYSRSFCVTLQTVMDDVLLEWVLSQAKKNPDWLFILKPRDKRIDYSAYLKYDNLTVINDFSIYEVLKYVHYNITMYSTTAIEAGLFDTYTLFYNVDNLSLTYFDMDWVYGTVINPGNDIQPDHLEIKESKKTSYFETNYLTNVANTILDI